GQGGTYNIPEPPDQYAVAGRVKDCLAEPGLHRDAGPLPSAPGACQGPCHGAFAGPGHARHDPRPGGIAGPYDGVPAEGFNLQGNSPGARSRQAFPGARPGLPGPPVAPLLLPAVEAAAGHIYLSQCPDGQGDLPGRDPQARNPELDG